MASGNFTISRTGSTSSYISYRVDWASTPNTAGNYSDIHVVVYAFKSSSSTSRTYGTANTTATVEGKSQSTSGLSFSLQPGGRVTLLDKYNYRVYHNNDGNKQTTISVNVGGNVMWGSGSKTVTLDRIPRASGVNNASGYVDGNATITIVPKATNTFTHSVAIRFGSDYRWLGSDGYLTTTEHRFGINNNTLSLYLPTTWYSLFTTERAIGTITVNTYLGNTKIGSSNSQLTVICNPALCNPYASATAIDSNPETIALTNNINDVIRYRSLVLITPKIQVSASDDEKTTLKSKSINGTPFTTDTVTVANPNDKSFVLKLVNSRNMSSEIIVETTGKLIPYIPLTCSASFARTEPTNGEVQIEYSGNYFAKTFGEGTTSSTVAVGDSLTSSNLIFKIPTNFYETIPTLINNNQTHLLETDKYKIFVGSQAGTMPHYFMTVETIDTSDDTYNEDNFIYYASYNELTGWTVGINLTQMNVSDTIDLGTVSTITSDVVLNDMFQNKDKTSGPIENTLSLVWKYREKGTEEWIEGGTLTPTIDAENNTYSGDESLGNIFDYRKQYEFIVSYTDKLTSSDTSIFPVSRGYPIFWWEEDAVHINGDLTVSGQSYNKAIVYEETLTEQTSEISVDDLDLVKDGGEYQFTLLHADDNRGEDVVITFNNLDSGYYFVWTAIGGANKTSGSVTADNQYKDDYQYIYGWTSSSPSKEFPARMDGKFYMIDNPYKKTVAFEVTNKLGIRNLQRYTNIAGISSKTIENLTSLTFSKKENGVFMPGTKLIIRKNI